MIRKIINAWIISKDFELKMKMTGQWIDGERRHKVKLTEAQLGILEYCAMWGLDSLHDIRDILKPKPEAKCTLSKSQKR